MPLDRGNRDRPLARLVLEGARVSLRGIARADARPAFDLLSGRPEVLDQLIWEGPARIEELEREYAAWRVDGADASNYHLAVIERASDAFAGAVTLRFAGHPRVGELGYWLGEPFWGRGLGSEAVRLASWLALEELGARLVQGVVFQGNPASRRALEKSGFALDRELRLELPRGARRAWHLSLDREGLRRRLEGWAPQRAEIERAALSPAPPSGIP